MIFRFLKAGSLTRTSLSAGLFILLIILLNRIYIDNTLSIFLSLAVSLLVYLLVKPAHSSKLKRYNNTYTSHWAISLSTLIGLFCVSLLLKHANLELNNFAGRTIGIVVLEGLDVSARSWLYINSLILFVIVFLLSYVVYFNVDLYASSYLDSKGKIYEKRALSYLSSVAIFAFIYFYIDGSVIYGNIFDILLQLIFLIYIILLAKVYFKSKKGLLKALNNYNLVVLSILFPLVVFFFRWVLVNGSFIFTYKYFLPYFVLWALFWLIIFFIINIIPPKKRGDAINALLSAAIPALFIPISIPLSNEIQFSISSFTSISPLSLSRLFIFMLLGTSFIIFLGKYKRTNLGKSTSYAGNYYLPILLATLVLFRIHTNFIEILSHFDLFHHGENLLPAQQLFSFGKIPFIDIYPTHGLSYIVGQVLYSVVNGYRLFEPWLWEWVTKIFEVLLFYFALKKIVKSSFLSATLIAFIPVLGIFGGKYFTYGYNTSLITTYYFSSFLPAISLIWALKKPNYFRLTLHWIVCFSLIAWRVDFGLATLVSTVFIYLVILLNKRFNKLATKLTQRTAMLSFVSTASVIVFIYAIFSLTKGVSPVNPLNQIIQFIKIQTQAQGLISLSTSTTLLVIFQYLLFPALSVFYISFFIIFSIKKGLSGFGQSRWLLLFLALFSLIMSIRSIQRQTLAVLGFNPYLFIFLGLCLPYYLKIKKEISIILFLLMLLGYYFTFPNKTFNKTLLLKTGRVINLHNWINKETRVHINDSQYRELAKFLNNNLEGEQTFLDFTSSPLLYVVTNKRFINFFISSAYYTSEPIQKYLLLGIEDAYRGGKIPIVIFRQPYEYANNIDGVPNEIRSYRLYEYIYQHYQPVGFVDGYMIWEANNYDLPDTHNVVPFSTFSQEFHLKKLPYIWANYDDYGSKENTAILSSLLEKPTIINPGDSMRLFLTKNIDKSTGNYLHLKIITNEPGTLRINYGINTQSSVVFDLIPAETSIDYLIRISSQWSWMNQEIRSMEFSPTGEVELVHVSIRKGD